MLLPRRPISEAAQSKRNESWSCHTGGFAHTASQRSDFDSSRIGHPPHAVKHKTGASPSSQTSLLPSSCWDSRSLRQAAVVDHKERGDRFCQLRSRSFFRARSIDNARASPPRPPLRAEASPRESHFDNLSCLVANASWVRLGCRNHHRATSGRYVGGVHQGRTFSHAANLDFEI
jgi:hypothetical protein